LKQLEKKLLMAFLPFDQRLVFFQIIKATPFTKWLFLLIHILDEEIRFEIVALDL
jgi:hypothetical protein